MRFKEKLKSYKDFVEKHEELNDKTFISMKLKNNKVTC